MKSNNDSETLSPTQLRTLLAIADTLLPSVTPPPPRLLVKNDVYHADNTKKQNQYWTHKLSQDDTFIQALLESFAKLSPKDRFQTRLLLTALSTRIGTLCLSGRVSFGSLFSLFSAAPFADLASSQQQTAILQQCQYSSILFKRQAFQGLKRWICGLAYSYNLPPTYHDHDGTVRRINSSSSSSTTTTSTTNHHNPYWNAMGYPGPPTATQEEDAKRLEFATNCHYQGISENILNNNNNNNNNDYDDEMTVDIVIVGSGAGGCVAAQVLSQGGVTTGTTTAAGGGYSVLLLEKGKYIEPEQTTLQEANALDLMYENHGLLTTADGNIMILAGATLGGGTTINWSCCLPLPQHVLHEWRTVHGLNDTFTPEQYDASLKYVLQRMGSADPITMVHHNAMNRRLQTGADYLGWKWETTGQNLQPHATHDPAAGYLCFGDRYGIRNGGVSAFLKEAVTMHGAKIIHDCFVERVETSIEQQQDGRRTATSVLCKIGGAAAGNGKRLRIHARKSIILAAGALHSPCILQRSGFRNKNIGKHLCLHPVHAVFGFSKCLDKQTNQEDEEDDDDDEVIDCFLHAPLTTACNAFELGPNMDGYGAKIECPSAHPGLLAAGLQWNNHQTYRERLLRFKYAIPFIVLQRDHGEGSVSCRKDGSLKIDYNMNKEDEKSLKEATQGAIKILLMSGAKEVSTGHIRDEGLKLDQSAESGYQQAVQHYLASIGKLSYKKLEIGVFSAHQMGSCRMGVSPTSSVVDPNGESWECDNLFIMDASTFPTASGANPMVTVLTIAHMLSSRLLLRLRHRDNLPLTPSEVDYVQVMENKRRKSTRATFSSSSTLLDRLPSLALTFFLFTSLTAWYLFKWLNAI